jgi:histidinol-phosphate aminotransferase
VRKYGLNRYPDFFNTDMLNALAAHHGLAITNYTPLAGPGEVGTVLAATLLRGGELVRTRPIDDPISAPALAWGGRIRRVPLARSFDQDLTALAAAVGPRTRLVQLQNPHDPTGRSFSQSHLERFLEAVARRNPNTHVWVDESYAPYSVRPDFPNSFRIIERDPEESRLMVSRTLSTAAGIAGAPTAYLAASRKVTEQTEGVTSGFFVPDAYGWANPEAGVSRMGEKALLEMLTPRGEAHLARVRDRNRVEREALRALLRRFRFEVVGSDASFLLCHPPGRYRTSGFAAALAKRGVVVLAAPPAWGPRLRGFVRIAVCPASERQRLERALGQVFPSRRPRRAPARRAATRRPARAEAPVAAAAAAVPLAALAASFRRPGPRVEVPTDGELRTGLTRRQLLHRAGLGAAATGALLYGFGRSPDAGAFPPDSFYDSFDLARMIYHENPVGPSPAALQAVREVIARGATAAGTHQDHDAAVLVDAILAYNRTQRPSARRLSRGNVMLLLGSAEGLMLAADTFVAGGTLIGEWPAYRIIRERVWQQKGTVIDVPLRPSDEQPDYEAIKAALRSRPDAGLLHFNAQNNPVGTVMARGEFDAFAEHVFARHPKTVILVDESDPEFMEPGYSHRQPDYLGYVARGQNLIHLQTFSHAFGLTGLRAGYLLAPARLIAAMQAKRIPRPISVFALPAALASLRDASAQVRRSYQVVDDGRRYLYAELDKLGLRYARSQGQYVFLDTGRSGTTVWANLIAQGVLTRYGREWGRESWLRVNPGLPDENRRFVAALRTALSAPDPGNPTQLPIGLDRLLPRGAEGRALAAGLERKLARDTWIGERLPPLRRPFRVVPAQVFRR